jgi:excinuclease ABC subunit B
LDPVIEIRPSLNQIDDLIEEIQVRELDERVFNYDVDKENGRRIDQIFNKVNIRCRYIHSDVDTLERIEIMQDLRKGIFDALIGVNLLREGLDLPEVSLAILMQIKKDFYVVIVRLHKLLVGLREILMEKRHVC